MTAATVLLVVPARANSAGVFQKHERPIAGTPLASRALERAIVAAAMAMSSPRDITVDVAVSTNDPAVYARAAMWENWHPPGTPPVSVRRIFRDDPALSHPSAPIHVAVEHAVDTLAAAGHEYDVVGIVQMTSPTLSGIRIAAEIMLFVDDVEHDSAATMTPFHGFLWSPDRGPLTLDRVNRQVQDIRWLETGGLQLVRGFPRHDGWYGADAPQIGPNHRPIEVSADEAIDIDTPNDVAAADAVLSRWRTLIVTRGGPDIGTGHLHRATAIASTLDPWSNVEIVTVDTPPYLAELVPTRWRTDYPDPADRYDVTIVDILDHPLPFPVPAKRQIRFETSDPYCGASHVVDALRPADAVPPRAGFPVDYHLGPDWFDLRWEFLGLPDSPPDPNAPILVTFGGTDPAGWSIPVANAVADMGWPVRVVRPPSPSALFTPSEAHPAVEIVEQPHMAALIRTSSLVVCSRGRTPFEAAHLGRIPITLPANERERSHATPAHAPRPDTISELLIEIANLTNDPTRLRDLSAAMPATVDGRGLTRILDLIRDVAHTSRTTL